jgi:hypothetical protein
MRWRHNPVMERLSATQKLFNVIVVIGIAAGCSSGTNPPDDASTDQAAAQDTSGGNDTGTQPDTGGGKDAAGDSFTGWLGC